MTSKQPAPVRPRPRQAPVWPLLISAALGPVTVFGGYWLMGGFDPRPAKPAASNASEKSVTPNQEHRGDSRQPASDVSPATNSDEKITPESSASPKQVVPSIAKPLVNPPVVEDLTIPQIDSIEELAGIAPISIAAQRRVAHRFQTVKAGTFLVVQYVDGKWSKSAGLSPESPDEEAPSAAGGRLMFFSVDGNGTAAPPVVVLGGTQNAPFLWKVPRDFSEWRMGIDDVNHAALDNTGMVRYRVARMTPETGPASVLGTLLAKQIETSPRIPVPDRSEQLLALAEFRKVFRSEIAAAKSSKDKQVLAQKLLAQAGMSPEPAMRYVLLDEARELSLEGGGLDIALSAIGKMAESYQVDELASRVAALGEIQGEIETAAAARKLEAYYNKIIGDLMAAHRYEEALVLTNDLSTMGLKVRDLAMRNRAGQQQSQIETKKTQWEETTVEDLLARGAKVPLEHERVGRHLAFEQGDWRSGLLHLACGHNPELRALARRELARPQDPILQIELADGWAAIAEAFSNPRMKTALKRRVADWYLRAEPNLGGKERERVNEQLRQLNQIRSLLDGINIEAAHNKGDWKLEDGGLISPIGEWSLIQTDFSPPEEYRVTLEAEWIDHRADLQPGRDAVLIGLCFSGRQFMAAVDWGMPDPKRPQATGLIELDGLHSWSPVTSYCHFSPPVLKRGQKNLIDVTVQNTGIAISVNGQRLVHYGESYARLGLGPHMPSLAPEKLFLGTQHASYRFTRFEVRRIPPPLD